MPRKQQIAQFAGTWLGPFVAIALVFILNKNSPLGEAPFTAPQASALASIMDGILGGDIPYWKYAAGAGLGADPGQHLVQEEGDEEHPLRLGEVRDGED